MFTLEARRWTAAHRPRDQMAIYQSLHPETKTIFVSPADLDSIFLKVSEDEQSEPLGAK
ncbi:MAG: hypothetical protein ACI8Z1_002466 [Candidatus Azotimanducaceae bacterium]|jgi:hypothetical protein